jgi:hypothetical protein
MAPDEPELDKSGQPAKTRGQHGGKRVGAGRPPGAGNALPQGAVAAIRALKHRVPDKTPEELADLAGEALETVAEVMRGRFRRGGMERLQAARTVREEICGPVPKRHELSGPDGGALEIKTIERVIIDPKGK